MANQKSGSTSSRKTERFLKKEARNYRSDDWVAFYRVGTDIKTPRVLEGNLTREEARWAYSREVGINYKGTRVRRVLSFSRIYS